MVDSENELKEFMRTVCPIVIDGFPFISPYVNANNGHYITFAQGGIKQQNVDMPLQDVLSTEKFKQTLQDYAQNKQRLIVRDWPSIRQYKNKWIIRARLVCDDGSYELKKNG